MIKKVVTRHVLGDTTAAKSEVAFWLSRPPTERLAAVDTLRKQYHGSSNRLQRSVRVIQ